MADWLKIVLAAVVLWAMYWLTRKVGGEHFAIASLVISGILVLLGRRRNL